MPRRESVDVVVVGAGFSGLAASRELVDAGLRVVVLEALARVGGRTLTVHEGGTWLELGGQWTGPGQSALGALAAELGATAFTTLHAGRDLIVQGGVTGERDPSLEAEVAAQIDALDVLARDIDPESPASDPDLRRLDEETLESWLEREVADPAVRRVLEVSLVELMTVPASELSMLTVLHSARTSGSLAAAMDIEGGAQDSRLLGGMASLADALAAGLGDAVRLGVPVSRISWNADGAIVEHAGGALLAQQVVVALAPSQAARIDWEPVLPVPRTELQRRMRMGSVIKINVVYKRPFWREQGLSGLVLDVDGPIGFCVDNSSPDSDLGVLTSFMAARTARRMSDSALGPGAADLRREAWTERAVTWFGPAASDISHYVDLDWSSVASIGGGYSGIMLPGAWSTTGSALTEPVGALHWAGSEAGEMWTGYVEGALLSGRRAAREILARRTSR